MIYYTSARSLARDPPYDPKVARRVGIDPGHPPIDTSEEMMEYLRKTRYRMLGPPGRFFSYSNEAFGLLGAIIERASGQRYESFIEQEILRPGGMDRTTFDTGVMFRSPEVTTLYSPNWTARRQQWSASEDWWDDTCLRASGGLRTNIEDLQRYLESTRTGGLVGREKIVNRKSVEAMMRPHVPISPGLFYGYGLAVQPNFQGTLLVHHSGGLKGVSSRFAVLPRKGLAGAVLANAEGVPSGRALAAGLNQLLGVPMSLDWVHIARHPPFPASLSEYAGWSLLGRRDLGPGPGDSIPSTPRFHGDRRDGKGGSLLPERGGRLRARRPWPRGAHPVRAGRPGPDLGGLPRLAAGPAPNEGPAPEGPLREDGMVMRWPDGPVQASGVTKVGS